jgi:hypothetical protein
MSGQPLRNPMDASKFREAYMANLDLRARLDDVNLQANKTYQRTGQLPVEPSDFRTSEEKLADLTRLRIEVRQRLGEIADGQQANKIAQTLTAKELQFYASQYPEINSIIKTRYALGVLADIFVPFLQNYMTNTSANLGVASGLQQVSGSSMLLSAQNVLGFLAQKADYDALKAEAPELTPLITNIDRYIPKPNFYQRIASVPDEDVRQELLQETNNLISNLPTKTDIARAIADIQRAKNVRTYDGSRDENAVGTTLGRVRQLITPTDDAELQYRNIGRLITPYLADMGRRQGPGETPLLSKGKKKKSAGGRKPSASIMEVEDAIEDTGGDPIPSEYLEIFRGKSGIQKTGKPKLLEALRELQKFSKGVFLSEADQAFLESAKVADVKKFAKTNLKAIQDIINKLSPRMIGKGLSVKKPRVDIIDPSMVDWDAGVKTTQRFVPFGRYIINTHRLQDNIVAIKRPRGGCLKDFPSTRIPQRLGAVIRIIVGGSVPSFEDLDELDDNERAYLHRLAKSSNISERLSIPAPKKSESDKELNEFEIMKGQIIAGNDNKDLIKKFKMLILKLSNKNVIPKPQVRELLLDLTNMGY